MKVNIERTSELLCHLVEGDLTMSGVNEAGQRIEEYISESSIDMEGINEEIEKLKNRSPTEAGQIKIGKKILTHILKSNLK